MGGCEREHGQVSDGEDGTVGWWEEEARVRANEAQRAAEDFNWLPAALIRILCKNAPAAKIKNQADSDEQFVI